MQFTHLQSSSCNFNIVNKTTLKTAKNSEHLNKNKLKRQIYRLMDI